MPEELLVVCGADDCMLALKGSDILCGRLWSPSSLDTEGLSNLAPLSFLILTPSCSSSILDEMR